LKQKACQVGSSLPIIQNYGQLPETAAIFPMPGECLFPKSENFSAISWQKFTHSRTRRNWAEKVSPNQILS